MNKSVDGYSTPVIYDNTPPMVGKLEVKGGGMNRFVTTNHPRTRGTTGSDYITKHILVNLHAI
jgi:hypothetical protein